MGLHLRSWVVRAGHRLLVVGEEPQHLDRPLYFHDLIHEPVVDVDPARVRSGEISDESFAPRRRCERVARQEIQGFLRVGPQPRGGELFRVLPRLGREDDSPAGRHQPGPFAQRETGVFIPLRIDSRIPGMESR